MPLELVTPPALEPVTLAEAKAHLRLETDADDALLTALIAAARARAEWHLGRALLTQAWVLWLDRWPQTNCVEIPLPPSQAVSTVSLHKEDGTATDLDANLYETDTVSTPARLRLKTTPSSLRSFNAIAIAFTAGYGDTAADVPPPIRAAILEITAQLYANRGDAPNELPQGAAALLAPYRMVKL